MPMYVYQVVEADGSDGEVFEVLQNMSEASLTEQPGTGKKVKRIMSAPRLASKFGVPGAKADLSPRRLGELGFTQYKKAGDGFYEKTVGSGPDVINRDGTPA